MTFARAVLAGVVLAVACTHAGDGPPPRLLAPPAVPDASSPPRPDDDDAGACPVPVDHASLEIARVDGHALTVCDVALRARQRTRDGLPPLAVRALVDDLVREASFAALAPASTSSRDRVVEEALAEALLRSEARAAVTVPDDAAVERWYRAHADDFERPARVRARWLVLPTEAAARTAATSLREGTPFADLLPHSLDPHRTRDHGDLGELRTDDVPGEVGRAVVDAAFALAADGDVAERRVRVAFTASVMVRGRRRPRRIAGWAVVQRVARIEALTQPLEAVRRRVLHRMLRERWDNARDAARARWSDVLHDHVGTAIDAHGLAAVRAPGR